MKYAAEYPSPVGMLTLTASETALTGIYLRPATRDDGMVSGDHPVLRQTCLWLDAYFQGKQPDPRLLPLAPEGTAFQRLIWKMLLAIPYGSCRTYGELAREAAQLLGKERMSAQAVGNAVGRNPISIIIPCHRVIAAGNRSGGYAWGLEAKYTLLRHEGVQELER